MLHSKTWKKGIVSALAGYGMSVSYDRVQDIELSVTKQLCKVFQEKGVVCPPTLKNGIFTTAAIDNIDYNPSSATEAFHDANISIFQHPEEEHPELGLLFDEGIEKINVPIELPESYTTIFPAKTLPSQYPLQQVCAQDVTSNDQSTLFTADEWLGNISSFNNARGMETPDVNERISWSAFHARLEQPSAVQQKSTSTYFFALTEIVRGITGCVVRHTMNIVNLVLQEINPGQISVLTGDQPVYAIGKQVQWHPDQYGEDKLVMMVGSLHIEMNFLSAIGDWLEGSGWVELLTKSSINTPGRAESMLRGN